MSLTVTFGRTGGTGGSYIPLENLMSARTEVIAIGTDTEVGSLQSTSAENMVTLTATTACYVAGGNNSQPDPTGEKRRYLPANVPVQFAVEPGTLIGVIAA